MNDDKIRLTLTKPALERLIGGDSELEVNLRHAAVKHILEKHIEPIVKLYSVQDIQRRLQVATQKIIDKEIGTADAQWVGSSNVKLSERAEKAVLAKVEEGFGQLIEGVVMKWERHFESIVGRLVEESIKNRIRSEIRKRMKAVLDEE